VKRLQQTLVPRPEAGARRTQVRWYPTHGYQRDQPSRLLAPALLLRGGENEQNLKPTILPLLDSGSHINAGGEPPPTAGAQRTVLAVGSTALFGPDLRPALAGRATCPSPSGETGPD